MTKMIISEDGVRYPAAFAEANGIKVAGKRETTDAAARPRTVTAVGAVVTDDPAGTVITTAADPSGADDGKTPVGTNLGLGDVDDATVNRPKARARAPKVD